MLGPAPEGRRAERPHLVNIEKTEAERQVWAAYKAMLRNMDSPSDRLNRAAFELHGLDLALVRGPVRRSEAQGALLAIGELQGIEGHIEAASEAAARAVLALLAGAVHGVR